MAKPKAPKGETAEQKFLRLGNVRVRKAVRSIKTIGSLGNYPHKATHTQKILEYLRTAVEQVEYSLGGDKGEVKPDFTLED